MPALFYLYNKYNLLPAFETMLSKSALQVRLGDIVTLSMSHVVTISISLSSTLILGIVRQCLEFLQMHINISLVLVLCPYHFVLTNH